MSNDYTPGKEEISLESHDHTDVSVQLLFLFGNAEEKLQCGSYLEGFKTKFQ